MFNGSYIEVISLFSSSKGNNGFPQYKTNRKVEKEQDLSLQLPSMAFIRCRRRTLDLETRLWLYNLGEVIEHLYASFVLLTIFH